jgi:hypothetical protein
VHGYPTYQTYDSGWACDRGYRATDSACVAVEMPPNAYLAATGDHWECERGYFARHNQCVPLQLPANAHLDFSGHDWECNRGFMQERSECTSTSKRVAKSA